MLGPILPLAFFAAFFAGLGRACESALPAADFEDFDVRASRRTFEAAFAAWEEVVSLRVLLCVSALPAALFESLPVLLDLRTLDAALAAFRPVALVAILSPVSKR